MPVGSLIRRAAPLLAALAAFSATAGALAQQPSPIRRPRQQVNPQLTPAPPPAPTLTAIEPDVIAALDSPNLAMREQATESISTGHYSLSAVEAALSKSDLSPEQRARLTAAARPIFERSPRAAIGVTFMRDPEANESTISDVEKGFDSFNVLKPGDAIRSINGRRTQNQSDVRLDIISREPGEKVNLGILRDGEPAEVAVRLGDRTGFANIPGRDGRLSADEIEGAWYRRCERFPSPPVAALISPLNVEGWRHAAVADARAPLGPESPMVDPLTGVHIRSPLPRPQTPELAMGGETRSPQNDGYGALADSSRIIINRPGGAEIIIQPELIDGRRLGANPRAMIEEQLTLLKGERGKVLMRMTQLNQQLRNSNPLQDQPLRNEITLLQRRVEGLDNTIDALQRMAGVGP